MQKTLGFWRWFQAGIVAAGLLSGCQKEGIGLEVGNEIAPEQAGLKVDWIGDVDRQGENGAAAENLGALYLQNRGWLSFDVVRLENTSQVSVLVFPVIAADPATELLELHGHLSGTQARNKTIFMRDNRPFVLGEGMVDYHSSFVIQEADLVFSSGGIEKIELNSPIAQTPASHFVHLRPGESAILRYRFSLMPDSSVPQSLPCPGGVSGVFLGYYPPEFAGSPMLVLRGEMWLNWYARIASLPTLYVSSPSHESTRPLYWGAQKSKILDSAYELPRHGSDPRLDGVDYTDLKVGQHFEGLPVFIR